MHLSIIACVLSCSSIYYPSSPLLSGKSNDNYCYGVHADKPDNSHILGSVLGMFTFLTLKRTVEFSISNVFQCLVLATTRVVYNLFFHPLRSYPGPKLWAATRLPWHWMNLHSRLAWGINALHEKYGPVVRIAPDELSYTSSSAWKKIYGQRSPEFPKCLDGRGIAPSNTKGGKSIITTVDREAHLELRQILSPAFSERALREQEGYFRLYSEKLISQLQKFSQMGPQDMTHWFALTAFDLIGDLAFGEGTGALGKCLEESLISPSRINEMA
jgi:Cytochrome P450